MKSKTEIQNKFIGDSLYKKNVLYNFYTGFGKSRVCTERIRQSKSSKKWLILVPKIVLINNFRNDYLKWNKDDSLIEGIICYDSIGKYKNTNLNVCCDEAQHCTESVLEAMELIGSDERIFLSATITDDGIKRINSHFALYTYEYSLSEGITEGISPKQDIRKISIELNDKHIRWEHKRGNKTLKLTAKGKYKQLSKDVDYWKKQYFERGEQWQQGKWMQAALIRKAWTAEYKLPICSAFLQDLDIKGLRYICFVNSVEQTKELGGSNAVHSKQSSKINISLIEQFNNKEINNLFTKDILAEGQNLKDCDIGIFLQLDGSEGRTKQKLGRVNRVEFPITYVFVLKGTQDEEYFNNNFEELKEFITEYKI